MSGEFSHSGSSGGSGGAPSGSAGGSLSGTYPNPSIAAGAVTSAMLAGSIAASKVTGTAITAADTGTITSTMILDGTIAGGDLSSTIVIPSAATATTQSAADNSAKLATTAYLDGKFTTKGDLLTASGASAPARLGLGNTGDALRTINGLPAWQKRPGLYIAPTGAIAETCARHAVTTTANTTTATIYLMAIELDAGMVVSNWNFRTTSGTTMAGGGNQWCILTDASRGMVAVSAGTTSATLPGPSTTYTVAVATIAAGASATYTVPSSGLYYTGMMIKASTMPTFVAANGQVQTSTIPPILGGTADAGQTTPPAFPFTAAAITATGAPIYCWLT